MADIGNRLRVNFGLINVPSSTEQSRWAAVTEELIAQGYSSEAAGEMAAKQLFPDYQRMKFASAGDTIEMLLRQAKDK